MQVAVVGHVEWVEFARVDHVPAPGEIVHALETWEEPAGGGAVAAVQLASIGGSCLLFTALAVRGLQAYAPRGRSEEVAGRIARARSWLEQAQPTETTDRIFQLLGLAWSNGDRRSIEIR